MKKIAALVIAAVMCAVIVCSVSFAVFAEEVSYTAYEIDTLNMSIPVPDQMLVLTRDSTSNDPFFKTFKFNYEITMAKLTEKGIYLQAMTKDGALTLSVTMTITEDSKKIESYNNLSDEELTAIMKKLREKKEYKDSSPVEYKGVKYICLNMVLKDGKKNIQAQQYNTVMNGQNICITMSSAPGKKLTAANKEQLTDIVKDTSILEDNFFNRNKGFILYAIITLLAIAIVVTAFILLLKYIRNPNRKHKILVHELAHEHKITETTQIPRKHILNVIKPTNTFLTKYAPVGELGKKKRGKQSEVLPDEARDIRSYSEPVNEEALAEQPLTSVTYEDAPDEIVVPVEAGETIAPSDSVQPETDPQEPAAEIADAEPDEEAALAEAQAEDADEAPEEPAQQQAAFEEPDEEAPAEDVEQEPAAAVQSVSEFDETADYFDVDPEEGEMFSYADVDTAVEDYNKAKKRRLSVNEYEENEEIPRAWDTAKRVFAAIGRGIVIVFKAIFTAIVFAVTHLKYFCINFYRMIKRNHAAKKRRKAEEQRRREASERRRMERDAERARRRNNANRGSNDLVQVRSSHDRASAPRPVSRERVDRQRVGRERYDRQRTDRQRSDRQRTDRQRSDRRTSGSSDYRVRSERSRDSRSRDSQRRR